MKSSFQGSIYDQMRANRWRTLYLFIAFPIVIIGLTYLGFLIFGVVDDGPNTIYAIDLANEMMSTVGFWILIGVAIWSFISYFFGAKMIMAYAGA